MIYRSGKPLSFPRLSANSPEGDLPRLWTLLMLALVELPKEYTEPLKTLLKAIQELPSSDPAALDNRSRASCQLRKCLSGFGHRFVDAYQPSCWRSSARGSNGPARDTLRKEHVRSSEVIARFIMAGLGGFKIDEAYKAVTSALESSSAILNFEVPAATELLVNCCRRFQEGVEKGEKSWGLKVSHHNDLWTPAADADTDVMGLERLAFWKRRLEEIQFEGGIVEDAAKRGLTAISEITLSLGLQELSLG